MIIQCISSLFKRKLFFLLLFFLCHSVIAFSKEKKDPVGLHTSGYQSNISGKEGLRSDENSYEVRDLVQYVDQNIGIDIGKCSFGVSMPFGSIRPCPHTPNSRNGYGSKEKISGFTNVNTGSAYTVSYTHLT